MEIYELTLPMVGDGSALPAGACKPNGLSIALGFFDGVHLGHANVIRRAAASGKERGQTSAVMTFDPHPRVVLGKVGAYGTILTPLEEKLELLANLGIEAVYVIRFTPEFAQVTAERFVRQLLIPLNVRTAVVGFDFHFGYRGEGNAQSLQRLGEGFMDVTIVEHIHQDHDKISSTRIRGELAAGNCEAAARLLGRPYTIKGKVVHGMAIGRQIGFPTANLQPEQPYVIPRPGVYAITAEVLDDCGETAAVYDGVLNIGRRPTFNMPEDELSLEAHLFDFSGNLYDRRMTLAFWKFLRDEQKFGSVEELKKQIEKDASEARRLLQEIHR